MMKNKVIWISLSSLLVTVMLLASCATSTTTFASTSTTAITKTTNTATGTTTSTTVIPTTATAAPTTTTTAGNWWDSLGTPQYGGELVLSISKNIGVWDPYGVGTVPNIYGSFMESPTADDWTLNPATFAYRISFRPYQDVAGFLAQSWEMTDASTYVIHLRQGIHWQNIPPANGREFTSADIVYHYDRMLGLGSGMIPTPNNPSNVASFKALISATATDKYTVVFKWSVSSPEYIMESMQALGSANYIENSDAVNLWGNLNDWHHAIGTGAFILTDFVDGSSATLTKNPNYWGYDERYPQNQLPYVNTVKYLIISDTATQLAGLRTGKIDTLAGLSVQNAQLMQKTNPEIVQLSIPSTNCRTVDPRNDVKPFSDIRVREAMQLAIDLPGIATNFYAGNADPSPSSLTSMYMTGWGWPYDQWPQDLKDQYAYNPTAAKQLLAAAGYPNGFNTNIVCDASGDLDLVQVVQSYFAAVGIIMSIRAMDTTSWTAFVQVGKKQDQMSFKAAGALGLVYQPTMQLQKFAVGNGTNFVQVNDPVIQNNYTEAMAAASAADVQKILTSENEYVARQHFTISLLQPYLFTLYWPWLKGFNGQAEALSASTGAGPNLFAFYAARVWIDQNLKKSMGH